MMPRGLFAVIKQATRWSAIWCIAATAAFGQNAAKDSHSPFLPPSSAAPSAQAAAAGYVLTGMTVVGKDTLLSVTNQNDKRSVWIPVGKTVGDITAVSYDPATEKAVIRAGGQSYTLALKKGAVMPGAAVPLFQPLPQTAATPAPAAPAPVEVPQGNLSPQEEKEMEARMLVTDLLEIGQQQRKAYAEAQRQAAAKTAGQPGAATAPQPKPATQAGAKK